MKEIKLISLNIEGDRHYDRWIPFVQREKPDVLCLQEVFQDDVEMIKDTLSVDAFFVPMFTIHETHNGPSWRVSGRGVQGTAIVSPHALRHTKVEYYQGSPDTMLEITPATADKINRALVSADVFCDSQLFHIVTTHFTITKQGEVNDLQRAHLRKVLAFLERHGELILCGDFNAPRGREIFDTLATHYTDNVPPKVLTTLDTTIHRVGKDLPDFVVDGLFTSDEYKATDVQVINGLSDHCAIKAMIHRRAT